MTTKDGDERTFTSVTDRNASRMTFGLAAGPRTRFAPGSTVLRKVDAAFDMAGLLVPGGIMLGTVVFDCAAAIAAALLLFTKPKEPALLWTKNCTPY